MSRYKLRTLLILLAIGPLFLFAAFMVFFTVMVYRTSIPPNVTTRKVTSAELERLHVEAERMQAQGGSR
jgi:hypothetical protein